MGLKLRSDQIMVASASFVIGVFANYLANLLLGSPVPIIGIFIGLLILSFYVLARYRPVSQVKIGPATTLRSDTDCETYAHKGLIVLVSYFLPIKVPREQQLSRQEYDAAAIVKDYRKLDLERSNLEPVIKAISSHACQLKHCWLISTEGKTPTGENTGSNLYVPALIEYLQQEKGIRCEYYSDKYVLAPEEDDEEIVKKTRDMVDRIYEESKGLGLQPEQIVADFTGGTRGMSTGLILACIDSSRDIQFIGTHYINGKPSGDLLPMMFEFEPVVVNKPT